MMMDAVKTEEAYHLFGVEDKYEKDTLRVNACTHEHSCRLILRSITQSGFLKYVFHIPLNCSFFPKNNNWKVMCSICVYSIIIFPLCILFVQNGSILLIFLTYQPNSRTCQKA